MLILRRLEAFGGTPSPTRGRGHLVQQDTQPKKGLGQKPAPSVFGVLGVCSIYLVEWRSFDVVTMCFEGRLFDEKRTLESAKALLHGLSAPLAV